MEQNNFPTIDLVRTGDNIKKLRKSRGLTVKQLQDYFGFERPQAIYKWQKGQCLPSVDNLFALSKLLQVPMQQILVESGQGFFLIPGLKDANLMQACLQEDL